MHPRFYALALKQGTGVDITRTPPFPNVSLDKIPVRRNGLDEGSRRWLLT